MNKIIPHCNHCKKQLQENQKKVITIDSGFNREGQAIDFDIFSGRSLPHAKEQKNLRLPLHFCDDKCFIDFFLGENYLKDVNNE